MYGNAAYAEAAYAQALAEIYAPPVIPPKPPEPSQWTLINDSQTANWKIINDSQ